MRGWLRLDYVFVVFAYDVNSEFLLKGWVCEKSVSG